MQNQWAKVELYGANNDGEKRRYAIADGTTVSMGDMLILRDPRSCSAALLADTVCAGIAAEDHAAGYGTSISAWTNGIFEALASGAIGLGAPIQPAGFNAVQVVGHASGVSGAITASGAQVIGYSLETAADNEIVNIRLRL